MKRHSFSWLLCTSVLLSWPAFAAEETLLAQTSLDELPATVELHPAEPSTPIMPLDAAAAPVETPAPTSTQEVLAEKTFGGLTLEAAIAHAIENSPRMQSFAAARLASQGERRQAGMWVNPEASVEAENIGGQGPYKGLDSAEVTYGVSQLIEIGGKRSARKSLADRGIDLANFDYQSARLDLIRDVTQAYAQAVAASEEMKLAREQQKLAGDVLQTVKRRVNAAREPLIQQSKANVALATSRIALEKAEREYDAARKVLAGLMGDPVAVASLDHTAFYNTATPPSVGDLKEVLARNPDLARWKPAVARSEAALDLEKANAVPDPRFSVGLRDIRDSGDRAFVAGISIPLPVLNRNQGNIQRAQAEVTKAASDQKTNELALGSELAKSLQAQQIAYTQATTLKKTILPEAERAFSLSRQGYQAGKFAYLEVLDAQRTLTEARLQYIEALQDYQTQRANVERLTATHLPTDTKPEETHDQE